MIRKILKQISVLAMAAAISLSTVSAAAASESIVDRLENTETDADFAEDVRYNLMRGNNLNFGECKISKLSSHEVNLFGLSQGHRKCDTMYLTLSLEWKVDGVYSTYKIWDFTANNVTSLTKSMNVIVPKGHYYRLRGYHAAKAGGVKESTSTLTSGILVN